jgi:hypothetical protein
MQPDGDGGKAAATHWQRAVAIGRGDMVRFVLPTDCPKASCTRNQRQIIAEGRPLSRPNITSC